VCWFSPAAQRHSGQTPARQGVRLGPHRECVRAHRDRGAGVEGDTQSGKGRGERRGWFLARPPEQAGSLKRCEWLTNELVSPSSLATALAMLELGASGSTEQGIATTLHTAGLTAEEQAAGWYSLAALLASETSTSAANLKRAPELDVANSLWVQQNFAVLPAFVRALSSEFQTGVWQVNFQTDLKGAADAINEWTSEHTKGLIKQLFSPAVSPRPPFLCSPMQSSSTLTGPPGSKARRPTSRSISPRERERTYRS